MENFWFYFKLGLYHVLDPGGLDHFYFLIALTLPFMFNQWRRLLVWITIFTIGHTISLLTSHFKLILFDGKWVEFLILKNVRGRSVFPHVLAILTIIYTFLIDVTTK